MTTSNPNLLPVGTLLDGYYRLGPLLGSGGFADVYSGVQVDTGMPIAIKFLRPVARESDGETYKKRFLQEARLAARLTHPNIVTVLACRERVSIRLPHTEEAEVVEQCYLVMEQLLGLPLSDAIKNHGPMIPNRALDLILSALEGLALGHQQNIVHKDLKPDNLFLSHPGKRAEHLKILDFGIARAGTEDEDRMTQDGASVYTPRYAAPEYIRGQVVTPALDVYQMALIFIEMLTGARVVQEEGMYPCLLRQLHGVEIPPPLLQSPLGPVLRRALHIDHNERTRNASDFAHELEHARSLFAPHHLQQPVPYSPPSTPLFSSDSLLSIPTPKSGESTALPDLRNLSVQGPQISVQDNVEIALAPKEPTPSPSLPNTLRLQPIEPQHAPPQPNIPPQRTPTTQQKHTVHEPPSTPLHTPTHAEPPRSTPTPAAPTKPPKTSFVWVAVSLFALLGTAALIGGAVWFWLGSSSKVSCDTGKECFDQATKAEKKKDSTKAYAGYEAGCTKKHAESCYKQGLFLAKGRGVKKSQKGAVQAWIQACTRKESRGCLRLMRSYAKSGTKDHSANFKKAKERCAEDDPEGCALLGEAYWTGRGVKLDRAKGVEWSKKACDDNHPLGCFIEGTAHVRGLGVQRDVEKGLQHIQKARDLGWYNARLYLARAAHMGWGIEENPEKTEKEFRALRKRAERLCEHNSVALACWVAGYVQGRGYGGKRAPKESYTSMSKACSLGLQDACEVRAVSQFFGTGTPWDVSSARAFFKEDCAQSQASSCTSYTFIRQREFEKPKAHKKALKEIEKLCDDGHLDACTPVIAEHMRYGRFKDALKYAKDMCTRSMYEGCESLASMYSAGDGVAEDKERAFKIVSEACAQQDLQACGLVALWNLWGFGTSKSPQRAKDLYAKLCDEDPMNSCGGLAHFYESGTAGAQDRAKARSLYDVSCSYGDMNACVDLGVMLINPTNPSQDVQEAVKLFEKACTRWSARGCNELGLLKRSSRLNAPPDERAANALFEKACAGDYSPACISVANYALHGEFVKKDYSKALTMYRKACALKNGNGCTGVGFRHKDGHGAPKDMSLALSYFDQGCELNDRTGCYKAGLLYAKGYGSSKDASRTARERLHKACELKEQRACAALRGL